MWDTVKFTYSEGDSDPIYFLLHLNIIMYYHYKISNFAFTFFIWIKKKYMAD